MNLELCASLPLDVAVAKSAGADRVELCGHWECGGLTPTTASVRSCVGMGIPVRALIRPRAGNFVYNSSEKLLIVAESVECLDAGAEKVVVGCLTESGEIDEDFLELLLKSVAPEFIIMHRALDLSVDPIDATLILQDFGIFSVLSSGAAPAAGLGTALIDNLVSNGMSVIAGGGVRPEDVDLLGSLGVEAIHASCRVKTEAGNNVDEIFDLSTYPLDYEKAVDLRRAVDVWNEENNSADTSN